jgi:hypothetical protein
LAIKTKLSRPLKASEFESAWKLDTNYKIQSTYGVYLFQSDIYFARSSESLMNLPSQEPASNILAPKDKDTAGMRVGAIVGVTLGLLAFIILIIILMWYYFCRQKGGPD